MVGWFVSLLLVMVFSVGAWIPGAVDGAITRSLQARLGDRATAVVHVEGDPLLQLPFGHAPVVEAKLTGLRLMEALPVKQLTLRLTDVRVQPHAVFFGGQAVLTAPAGAWMALEVDTASLQAQLDQLAASGAFSGMQAGVALFGQKLTFSLHDPTLSFEAGRVRVSGVAEMSPSGAKVPVEASAAFAIEDGARLNLVQPQLALNGRPLPGFLVAGAIAQFNPVLDLNKLTLPDGSWKLLTFEVVPAGVTLKVGGQLTALPK